MGNHYPRRAISGIEGIDPAGIKRRGGNPIVADYRGLGDKQRQGSYFKPRLMKDIIRSVHLQLVERESAMKSPWSSPAVWPWLSTCLNQCSAAAI
jgi:hypothetical protein